MVVDGFNLSGKRALVVGAGLPVGRAIAEALDEAGARVAAAAGQDTGEVEAPPVAPIEPGAADQLVRDTLDELGGLDVVVWCGDQRMAGPFTDLTDEAWDRLVAYNLTAPARLLRAAGRVMLERGGGRLICVVSILGERGLPHTAAYGACQAGLIQLIRALALEWARQNVRVNGIALGWFEGDPLLGASVPDQLLRYLPARRLGQPEDVGALAVYLASDAADMMTGQTIVVDGGVMSHA